MYLNGQFTEMALSFSVFTNLIWTMTDISKSEKKIDRPLAQLLSAHAIGAVGLGSNPRSV